ncbi:MAG: hypothetical protein AAF436_15855 [Myxococcota bacterium]
MKPVVIFGKLLVLAGWFWGIASFIAPGSVPRPDIGRMMVLGLLAVHVAEAFVFAKKLASEDGGSVGQHVGQLMVFGYLHVLGVRYE